MQYRKLRSFARWLTGPLALSLVAMCLPTAQARSDVVTTEGRVAAGSPRASAPKQGSQTTRSRTHGRAPAVARSLRPIRNPRDDRPRGAGIGRGSGMRTLGLTPPHALSTTPSAGGTYEWEGTFAMTNTGNGNKLTKIPLFGWTARGGMPIEMALYHNSHGTHNSELG